MLIYNQCRKQFCSLIFFGPVIIFQDSLINKKLNRTEFIQNINVVFQYALLFKSLWSVHFFCIQSSCVKWIKGDIKDLYC